MTLDDAMKLEAGRELDRLIAERVMGWDSGGKHSSDGLPVYRLSNRDVWLRDWKPSTDIAAAWLVVEKMRESGLSFHIGTPRDDPWSVQFNRGDARACWNATADTAPLAICRAALKVCWKD